MRCLICGTRLTPTPRLWGFVGVVGIRVPVSGEYGFADSGAAQSRSFP